MTNHLAAIREAAEQQRGLKRFVDMGTMKAMTGAAEMVKRADKIIRLLDAAEKDSACDVVMWGPHDPFYSCCRCGIILPADSNFCPGCGRRIVKEEKD